MFRKKELLPKIKCIITGQTTPSRIWYNCKTCNINYSVDVFSEYNGWSYCPNCIICNKLLDLNTIPLASVHKRR